MAPLKHKRCVLLVVFASIVLLGTMLYLLEALFSDSMVTVMGDAWQWRWPADIGLNVSEANRTFYGDDDRKYMHFIKDSRHKLLYCFISKNSCTIFKALFHAMINNGTPRLPSDIEPLHAEIDAHHALYKPSAQFVAEVLLNASSPWRSLVILRDPLERLVSGFNDKCVRDARHWCEGPNRTTDFRAFVERVVRKIHAGRATELNDHYRPQHTFCGMQTYFAFYDHVIYYDARRIAADTLQFMRAVGIEEYYHNWGDQANRSMFEEITAHATTIPLMTTKQKAKHYAKYYNHRLALQVMEAYKLDYELLHIRVPAWMHLLRSFDTLDPHDTLQDKG